MKHLCTNCDIEYKSPEGLHCSRCGEKLTSVPTIGYGDKEQKLPVLGTVKAEGKLKGA